MVFDHNPLTSNYWFEDCPMIFPTLKAFIRSNKKYLFIFKNVNGEYLGEFYDNEPNENLFIDSFNRKDECGALFERNFNVKVDLNDVRSIEESLDLIDQDIY